MIVDGGKGQLGIAVEVLKEFDLLDQVPVVGLAKQHEEIFTLASGIRFCCRATGGIVPGAAHPRRGPSLWHYLSPQLPRQGERGFGVG